MSLEKFLENKPSVVTIAIGAGIAATAVYAFLKTGSKPSLISGGISGSALVISGVVAQRTGAVGFGMGMIVAGALGISMTSRAITAYKKDSSRFPKLPVIIAVVSATALGFNLYGFYSA